MELLHYRQKNALTLAFSRKPWYNADMILTDVHTHSTFSVDGKSPLIEMVETAREKHVSYFGVSEHFDYDCLVFGLSYKGTPVTQTTDAEAYFTAARTLQTEYKKKGLRLLVGGEYGFGADRRCYDEYLRLNETYRPDFVVNSVHTVDGYDCYDPAYYTGKDRNRAYSRYLEEVRKSLDAPYDYDIVGHIGYVSRRAPYENKLLHYADFPSLYDDILKTIVAKGKILEVNSSSRGSGIAFLPDSDVLTRYFQLGGRRVSFGSDAHEKSRIMENRDLVIDSLKKIGFTYVTVPDCKNDLTIDF